MNLHIFSIISILIIIGGILYTVKKKSNLCLVILVTNILIFILCFVTAKKFGVVYESNIFYDLGFKTTDLETGEIYTIFTSMYIHGGILHLLFNLIVLLLIGIGFEDRVGTFGFGFIYFVSGIFAVIFFMITNNFEYVILVGASGAICGILGAFARLFPRERMVMFFMFFPLPPMPVYVIVTIVFILQVIFAIMGGIAFGAEGRVAYTAHIGGILTGFLVAPLIRKIPSKTKVEKIDYDKLDVLAITPQLREKLEKIRSEDIEEIKRAWIEDFVFHARCPNCHGRLYLRKREVRCQCGYCIPI